MRLVFGVTLLGGFGLLTAACDSFVEYTVVNETDQQLEAWVLFADCREVVRKRGEYDYDRTVPPHQTVEVFDVTGSLPDSPWWEQFSDEPGAYVFALTCPEVASQEE